MATTTNDTKVEGSVAAVIHLTYNDTDLVWERTVLALTTKDDLSATVDEDDESIDLSTRRRTQRHRTNNTVDVEVTSAVAPDVEVLTLVGVVDADGNLETGTAARTVDSADDEYIELAYFDYEPDFGAVDVVADSELLHRFADCELTSPEIDPSETPITASWTWWVDGTFTVNATGDPPAP